MSARPTAAGAAPTPTPTSSSSEYISTASGSRVHRSAQLRRPDRIALGGRCVIEGRGTVLHSDRAPITLGSRVAVGEGVTLRPGEAAAPRAAGAGGGGPTPPQQPPLYEPMTLGDGVVVGRDSVVEARHVGTGARIGAGCVVGPRCVVHDGAVLVDLCVLPPDTVVPPLAVVAGCPGRVVGEVGGE
jgi:dynactin 5